MNRITSFFTSYAALLLFIALVLMKIIFSMGLAEGDDLYYVQLAHDAADGDFSASFIFDVRWMVFMPTALLYRFFGINDITSLFFPVFYSSLSLLFAYNIVRREIGNRAVALSVLALYGTFPMILTYGNFLQVAPAIECLTLGTIFFIQKGIRSDRFVWYGVAGLFLGLIAYTRVTGMFIALPLSLYAFWKTGFRVRTFFQLAVTAFISLIPFTVQGLVYLIIHDNFFHRIVLSRRVLKYQNSVEGMDAKDLFFYIRTMFVREGLADYRFFSIFGYMLIPSTIITIIFALFRKKRESLLFLIWLGTYFIFMTFMPTSLSPYTTLIRNIRYAIIFSLPLISITVLALYYLGDMIHAHPIVPALTVLILVTVNLIMFHPRYERFHDYTERQRYSVKKFLDEHAGALVYLADRNIDRRLLYYSGYTFTNFRKINNLNQIREPGYMLMLPGTYHHRRYLIPKKKYVDIIENPPSGWKHLGFYGFFHVMKVPRGG